MAEEINLTINENGEEITLTLDSQIVTFTELTDTPSNYVGQAGKSVTVKVDESGMEFTDAGSGDMTKVVYDPNNINDDAFDMSNMVESATEKILTDTERDKLTNISVTQPVDLDTIETDTNLNNIHREIINGNPHGVTTDLISDFDTGVSDSPDVALNTTHRSSDGTDHTFINQDLRTTATPEFRATDYTTGQVNPTYKEGEVFYDDDKKALSYYNNESDITVNLGQEILIPIRNETGATIPNGSVLYPSGGSGGVILADLANAQFKDKSRLIAVATHDIENNSNGYVTRLGGVGGLDTSAYSEGDVVYLSKDTPGAFTMTRPDDGAYVITVGVIARSDATNGILSVDSVVTDITVEVTDTNGFPSSQRANTTLSFVNATRTFTITPVSSDFHFYDEGNKFEKFSAESIIISDVEGLHVVYYDSETLTTIANPTRAQIGVIIRTHCLISYIYWDVTNQEYSYFGDERHGISMSPETHAYLHFTRGAQFIDGLGVGNLIVDGNGDLDIDAQFSVASGITADEDLITVCPEVISTAGLPIYYLDGANADMRRTTESGFSVLTDTTAGVGVTGRLVWNEWTGSTWQLTTIGQADFVLCHIFAVNGIDSEDKQIAVIGQADYITALTARAGADTEITNIMTMFPFEEVVPVATIILQTSTLYDNAVSSRVRPANDGDYVDWRTTELVSGTPASDHNSLTNLELAQDTITWGHINDQAQTIAGLKTFTTLPQSSATPTVNTDFVTKEYGDANYGGGGTSVNSVFGRIGTVLAVSGDYEASEVTNAYDLTVNTSDDIIEGTNKFTTSGDISKLAGIEALAEVNNISDVNATDLTDGSDTTLHFHATDRNRTNHTGTQTASTISDFTNSVISSLPQPIDTTDSPTFAEVKIEKTGDAMLEIESLDHLSAGVTLKRTGDGFTDYSFYANGGDSFIRRSGDDGATWDNLMKFDSTLNVSYVDFDVEGDITGNNLSGTNTGDNATNSQYASLVSFPEAPNDGNQYARQSEGWSIVTGGGSGKLIESGSGYKVDNGSTVGTIGTNSVSLTYGTSTSNGATGSNSFTSGRNCEASAESSTAMGNGNKSQGQYSFSVGFSNISSGNYSNTFGFNTESANDYASSFGKYNDTTNPNSIFSVGNGTSDIARSNAFEVLDDGTVNATAFVGDGSGLTGIGGTGDVVGPASSVDNNLATFDLTTGKLIQDSGINISAVTDNTAKVSYPGSASEVELNILDGATLTTVELNYVDGVTSPIQTQLNSKLGLSGGTMTDDINMGNNSITGIEAPTYNGEVVDTYLATKTIDFSTGSRRVITLTGNSTITFSAGGVGTSILRVIQGGAGSFAITFNNLKTGLTAPEILTGVGEETMLIVVRDGDGDYWVQSMKLE